jgi:coproporphyrinogen III oxidase-like Fe-S oxidoreductase
LNHGIDWNQLRAEHDPQVLAPFESVLTNLAYRELLDWEGGVVRLTRKGMLLSNEVFQEFI